MDKKQIVLSSKENVKKFNLAKSKAISENPEKRRLTDEDVAVLAFDHYVKN